MPLPRSLYDLERDELTELLDREPSYRVDQVWSGLYEQFHQPADISTLPKTLKARLEEIGVALHPITESVSDNDQTIKWLWGLNGGAKVETVLMHYKDRSTVCVSSQAGCAMACGFCATGQAGFERQMTTGEIVEQVVRAANRAKPRRVSNIVMMGMGEPLANYNNTMAAMRRLNEAVGISARHLTISTVGVVPGINKLAEDPLPVNLAVSLHAANDKLRSELVPLNDRYPLDKLIQACRDYFSAKRRRISFEWAMIADTNDRPSDAAEFAEIAKACRAHINLIPLNPTPGYPVVGTHPKRVKEFAAELEQRGANVTIRRTRGTEIDAACGQLRAGHEVKVSLGETRS